MDRDMQWKAAVLVAAMASGAMLAFGGPASALTTLVANPNIDPVGLHAQAAPFDRTFTPPAAGSDLFVSPGPGYRVSGADPSDGEVGLIPSTPPGRAPGIGFGLPDAWTLLILGLAMLGFVAMRAEARALAGGGGTWGRPSPRRYSRNFSIFPYARDD